MTVKDMSLRKLSKRSRLALCIALGGLIYVYYLSGLTTNPPAFYLDESALSYTAHTIYESGHDEYGHFMPLYFPVFPLGPPFYYLGYAEPVQIYSLAALFYVFPPSAFLARALSATAIFLTCIFLGLLGRKISGRDLIGVIVALTAFLTPWLFEIGRLAFSASLYPLTIALLLFAIYRACQRDRWSISDIIFIALSLALTTYTYAIGRLLGPLLAFGLILLVTNLKRGMSVLLTWVAYALTLIPILIFHLRNPDALTGRFSMSVGYYSPIRPYSDLLSDFVGHVIENVSLRRLLLTGDPNLRHHVGDVGSFLAIPLLLALVSVVVIAIRHWRESWWRYVIYGLIVSIVPASLTKDPFHSLRLAAFPVFLLVLMIPALMWLMEGWERRQDGAPARRVAFLGARPFRAVALTLLLLLTFAQAGYFQYVFQKYGPDRGGYFDYNFPPVFAAALAQPKRPIYLVDQFYYHALWQAIVQGVDRSNFEKLPPYERPPANSIVLSGEERCSDCNMLYTDIPFVVYETLKDPPVKPKEANPSAGAPAGNVPQLSAPRGIAVDSNRNYYIADTGNSRIQKFDPDGKVITTFGTRGEGEGELREPQGIAVDPKGSVYVTDALNHKLVKFTADGAFVKEWRGPDTGFYGPRDLAFGPDGKLYIVDQGRTRVVIFDTATDSFSSMGSAGTGDGQFNDPSGIAVGGGFVFVADTGNGRIEVFDLKGNYVRQWPVPQWQADARLFPDAAYDEVSKRLYVSCGKSNEVLVYDMEGLPVNDFTLFKDTKFDYPSSMVISESGNSRRLFVLNTLGGNLSIFDLEPKRK